MSSPAFDRYAPFIQEYIYRKKWTDLRQVQTEACAAILDTDSHVIIASGTASGKTEAAFFPILTQLEQDPPRSIGVIYIGPLKALINDQFERLSGLLEERDIPLWPWHGDVSASVKARAVKAARGILQITPESLEALIMGRPGDAKRMFCDLRFVVIDEIHALMGADRGLQVLCLLTRLERLAGCSPRRVGLSATLNDYGPAMDFLGAGSGRETAAVGITGQKRTVALCAESFLMPGGDGNEAAEQAYDDFLYDSCRGQKCLIFTNSRSGAEEIVTRMKSIAAGRNEPDIFHVHHGSVSAALRQETEQALREGSGPTVAAATLTLELGIDIGSLDTVIQAGAPGSCSSFVQRLGRSGRRTGKSKMVFVSRHAPGKDTPYDALPWDLIRSCAVIQLYMEERWVEPFTLKPKPFSLLCHQTLSALMSAGELSPQDLARSVLTLPPFRDTVTQEEYRELLRNMLDKDFLQRMETGGLIVGMEGEKFTNYYTFYAVFPDEETYRVLSDEGEVGTLTLCPKPGDVFSLAGRSWSVQSVDTARKLLYVKSAAESAAPAWSGGVGDVHARVAQRMKGVLTEDAVYAYLRPNAAELLTEARTFAKKEGLLEGALIPGWDGNYYLCPWTGTKELRTIQALLTHGLREELSVTAVDRGPFWLTVNSALGTAGLMQRLQELAPNTEDPDLVLSEKYTPRVDKFDFMVPEPLLRTAYLHNQLDVPAALEILRSVGWGG